MQAPKYESEQIQRVTHRAKHKFQWSRGVATCTCGGWTLWGAILESARRNFTLHMWNSYEAQIQRGTARKEGVS